MDLSIIVTTRNRKSDLVKCIKSIEKSNFDSSQTELIIVDDASTDGTQLLKSSDLRFRRKINISLFHLKKQLMMVGARNLGAKKAQGKYLLFIDDDNIIDREMIDHLLWAADNYPDYGIIGPSMHYLNSKRLYMNSQSFDFISGHNHILIKKAAPNQLLVDTDGVPNVFLIKKEVFQKVGYFEPDLIQTCTESDFSFRAKSAGFRSGISKKAVTYHNIMKKERLSPRSLGGNFPQKAYCLMRNRSLLVKRYANPVQKYIYLFAFSWFWPLVYSLLVLRFKRFDLIRLYWYGYRDGIRYLLTGKLINSLPRLMTL